MAWRGGATVFRSRPPNKMLWQHTHLVQDLNIDIVFIDIGSNDLSNRASDRLTPLQLAQKIESLAVECLNLGARQIMISEILPRRGLALYNERVAETNRQLNILFQNNPRIYFWQHNHNNFATRFLSDYIHRDGIHVHQVLGMARYFSSVRGSVIFAENRIRN